jgi:probable rRNA maturation factor
MINFNYETEFQLSNEVQYTQWISAIIKSENKSEGEITYVFCDDDYLLQINQKYLDHDTLTDVISFDYSVGNELNGDVFISVERVLDNAKDYETDFENELMRVMAHGLLHYCGYKDKTDVDRNTMQIKEDEKINMFHGEH